MYLFSTLNRLANRRTYRPNFLLYSCRVRVRVISIKLIKKRGAAFACLFSVIVLLLSSCKEKKRKEERRRRKHNGGGRINHHHLFFYYYSIVIFYLHRTHWFLPARLTVQHEDAFVPLYLAFQKFTESKIKVRRKYFRTDLFRLVYYIVLIS